MTLTFEKTRVANDCTGDEMSNNVNNLAGLHSRTLNLEPNFVTVKIGTGDDVRSFGVHKDLICAHSPFFKSALSGDWEESISKCVELPEDNKKAFDLYLHWLYRREILSLDIASELSTVTSIPSLNENVEVEISGKDKAKREKAKVANEQTLLVNACILGDKIADLDFADAAIDALIKTAETTEYFPLLDKQGIYQKTSESSPLRKLFADLYVFVLDPDWGDEEVESLSRDALCDITKRFFQAKKAGQLNKQATPWKTDPCVYHHHVKTDKPCYKTKLNTGQPAPKKNVMDRGE